jgi:transposase
MNKKDARYQKLEQLHERRKQVVRLYQAGCRIMAIVELTGLSYPSVRRALSLYEAGGMSALRPATRGRKKGTGRSLSPEQEEKIRDFVSHKRPEQLQLPYPIWTRAAVQQLIEQQCGVILTVRSAGNYLARWGIAPQRPIPRWLLEAREKKTF